MKRYFAYGANIHSELPLPELRASVASKPDITVELRQPSQTGDGSAVSESYQRVTPTEAVFFWDGVGTFRVSDGSRISIQPAPGAGDDLLRLPLLGVVMAAALSQRDQLMLHASAMEINGQGVAFIGDKGSGKSTTTAYLCSQGFSYLSDDNLPVTAQEDGRSYVCPSFPQIKLWPDAAAALGKQFENSSRVCPGMEKLAHQVETGLFTDKPVLLDRIYLLREGEQLEVAEAPARGALFEVLANTFLVRFGLSPQTARWKLNFEQCAQLVSQVPIYVLRRPRDLALLPKIASLVEAGRAGAVEPALLSQA